MDKNEWYQIGEDIKRQVQDAIDSNDFSQLSKTIGNTVGQAVGDVGKAVGDVGKGVSGAFQEIRISFHESFESGMKKVNQPKKQMYNGDVYYGKPNLRPDAKLFNRSPQGKVSGVLIALAGFGLMGAMVPVALITMIQSAFFGGAVTELVVPAIGAATGFGIGMHGVNLRSRYTRFTNYVSMLKDKLYCSVEDLAARTGRKARFIRKDLKKMMQKGMFLQGHMDKNETVFIASNEVYEQYLTTQKQYEERTKLLEDKAKEQPKEGMSAECRQVLEEGREYIRIIRLCNDEIPGEEMSDKLYTLEQLVTRIFEQVEKEPSLAPELKKMMSYYLPTTQKLVETYRDLDKQNIQVQNVAETKLEIEKTMNTINKAFETFLNDLFRDKAWDIQSDISVLNTMLKQDGYIGSDFSAKENEETKCDSEMK